MRLFFLLALLFSDVALAVPLDNWPTWSVAEPYISKQVPPYALIARCKDLDEYCVVEVDKTTGEIPVSISGGISIDYSGPTGAPTPAAAAYIGGIDQNGNLQGVSVDTLGVVNVSEGGKVYADSVRYDYTGGSVTTGAWTQIIASTAAAMNEVCVTDQSGQIMLLGTGALASETTIFMIARGFSGCIPLTIPSGTRVALKAVSATASTGDFVLSGMN